MRIGESVFRRKDGRWEARYCKSRRANGGILYGSVYGKTREEAEEKRTARLRAERSDGGENAVRLPSDLAVPTAVLEDAALLAQARLHEKYDEPLDEPQTRCLEAALANCQNPVRTALVLALYLGVRFSEICALRYEDIDLGARCVTVKRRLYDRRGEAGVLLIQEERRVPIPRAVLPLLEHEVHRKKYLLSDSDTVVSTVRKSANLCLRELNLRGFAETISMDALSATFIRRAFEAGVNTETVAALTGVDSGFLCKKYGKYAKANLQQIENIVPCKPMDKTDQSTVKTTAVKSEPRGMNLLILGAGSQGPVVREIAEALGIFGEIAYLDDDPANALAMDTCANYLQYLARFPIAIPSFGDCELRAMWCVRLEQAGFILPKLIHPSATVSGNVEIGAGTVIEAKVILSSGVQVGKNCIISAGSVIDKEASVGDNTHIGCACTVPKGCRVPGFSRLNSGTLYRGMSEQPV